MSNYGDLLKHQRELSGLNQPELAKAIGTSQQNVSRWERNEVIPGIDFCIKIAEFYNISLDELFNLSDTIGERETQKAAQPKISNSAVNFANEFEDIIADNNFVSIAKLYKAINPQLRGLILGYIVGVLQSQGVNTQQILKY